MRRLARRAAGLLWELDPQGVAAVHAALAEDAARTAEEVAEAAEAEAAEEGRPAGARGDGERAGPRPAAAAEHALLNYYSTRALRRALLAAGEGEGAPGGGAAAAEAVGALAEALWSGSLRGRCGGWVGGHAEKVLAALLHCASPLVVAEAGAELKRLVQGPLDAWAARFLARPAKGAARKAGAKGKDKGAEAGPEAGPSGSVAEVAAGEKPVASGKQARGGRGGKPAAQASAAQVEEGPGARTRGAKRVAAGAVAEAGTARAGRKAGAAKGR